MSASIVLCALLAQATPVIQADGTEACPAGAAVSERLAGLLRGQADLDPGPPDVVALTLEGAELQVRLSRADGTLVAERRIPRSNTCAELADAAAALVAAWVADLRPSVPPAPPAAAPAPAVVRAATPEPDRATYELGALPALSLGEGHWAFAGAIRAGTWSRRAPVGMTVALSSTFPVESGDPADLGRWRRHALSAGVMGRLRHQWLFVDGIAEAVMGWLVVDRQDGATSEATFDPGLTIGLRAGTRVARRLELYASLAAWGAAWNKPSTDGTRVVPVPHWGLLAGLGASFLFGP